MITLILKYAALFYREHINTVYEKSFWEITLLLCIEYSDWHIQFKVSFNEHRHFELVFGNDSVNLHNELHSFHIEYI